MQHWESADSGPGAAGLTGAASSPSSAELRPFMVPGPINCMGSPLHTPILAPPTAPRRCAAEAGDFLPPGAEPVRVPGADGARGAGGPGVPRRRAAGGWVRRVLGGARRVGSVGMRGVCSSLVARMPGCASPSPCLSTPDVVCCCCSCTAATCFHSARESTCRASRAGWAPTPSPRGRSSAGSTSPWWGSGAGGGDGAGRRHGLALTAVNDVLWPSCCC